RPAPARRARQPIERVVAVGRAVVRAQPIARRIVVPGDHFLRVVVRVHRGGDAVDLLAQQVARANGQPLVVTYSS
ncbi:hypothetical protein HC928_09620, partial [bacterium]|nr:hypothetical protein [bacterium]